MSRKCNTCGIVKARDEMVNDRRRPGTIGARCKDCHNAQVRANKDSRRVWHSCEWCGDERKIDKREVGTIPVCRKCQNDDVNERQRVRRYILDPIRRERYALDLAKRTGAQHLRSIGWSFRRTKRDLYRVRGANGRLVNAVELVCGNCESSFTTHYATSVYCSKRCSRRAAKKSQGRFWVPDARRLALYERDEWTCKLCERPAYEWGDESVDRSLWATLDHIVPQSRGGSDDDENLRLAHALCNSLRGDNEEWEYADAA